MGAAGKEVGDTERVGGASSTQAALLGCSQMQLFFAFYWVELR